MKLFSRLSVLLMNSVGGVKMGCLSLAKSASTFLVVKGFVVTGLVALY